ncbi:hypothetical protein LTR84_012566 [Exophiala bonariae]|uniref:Uncharacterized protein n=1 Tax=Exophiala bonariae TaxID=1690606 RepID=A0AAV9NFD8_9EURO|nr:hypothetical protein LTR84_012566 [Exophiala bonariae]
MQRVRQEELALGKKRPTGRDHPKRASRVPTRSTSSDSDSSALSDPSSTESQSSSSNQFSSVFEPSQPSPPSTWHLQKKLPFNIAPAVHEFDPFGSLPAAGFPQKGVESLLRHCFDVLLPMTFVMEKFSSSERTARQGMVLRQKVASPAVFLGFMGTVAAHRAILRGSHGDLTPSEIDHDDLITDPEYKQVKFHTLVAVRKLIEANKTPDQSLVDACYGLVSVATIVGNIAEAKVHLQGIKKIMSMANISEESVQWLPITNVKLATAMLSLPLLPIPWERHPIPEEVLLVVSPPPEVDQSRLGSSFTQIPGLSDRLRELFSLQRDLCNICDFNARYPGTLPPAGHFVLNRKGTELEYDLVAYPYEIEVFERDKTNEPVLPALEGMIRLAGLGLLTTAPHSILPSSGSGRAITHHQKRAFQKWAKSSRRGCSRMELQVILWALFIFTECAGNSPEAEFFIRHMAELVRELFLIRWEEVELMIYGLFYIPGLQAKKWREIYNAAMSVPWRDWASHDIAAANIAIR